MMLITWAWRPPIWLAMLPQKFSAATTVMTRPVLLPGLWAAWVAGLAELFAAMMIGPTVTARATTSRGRVRSRAASSRAAGVAGVASRSLAGWRRERGTGLRVLACCWSVSGWTGVTDQGNYLKTVFISS